MIKSYLRGEQTNWDINLGCLAGAYRSSPKESTGLTPNLMMLGREVTLPFEIIKQRKKRQPIHTRSGKECKEHMWWLARTCK